MIATLSAEDEPLAILGYGDDDRWYVLGIETTDPALVLGVMFGFAQAFAGYEAPEA
jgi:hypothetical protein